MIKAAFEAQKKGVFVLLIAAFPFPEKGDMDEGEIGVNSGFFCSDSELLSLNAPQLVQKLLPSSMG
jgi:hypothetical protein